MRTEFTFCSADGKTEIHAVRWEPEGKPTGILQITHGMAEHIERYADFAEYVAGKGMLCVGMDLLGHGKSIVREEQLGFFAQPNPSGVLLEDMHALRTRVQRENPDLPYFMLGHSMGSYLLRKYLAFHGEGLAGALIISTGNVPAAAARMGIQLCKTVAAFRGWNYRSAAIENLALGGGAYKLFDQTGKEPEKSWLTRDVAIVRRYYADPCCGFRFTVNGFRGLFEAIVFDGSADSTEKLPHDLPLIIASGDQDPVGDLGKGPRAVAERYREAGQRDVTLKLYPDARHEILNELNRAEVWADLFSWMEGKMKAGKGENP